MPNHPTKPKASRSSISRTNTFLTSHWRRLSVATALAVGLTIALFAQAAETAVATYEGETFTGPAGSSVYADSSASAGSALLMPANGIATKQVTTPAATRLEVRAKGDFCKGAPQLAVSVDGAQVLATAVTGSWSNYSVTRNLTAGSHALSVAFINDRSQGAKCSRNLRFDKLTLYQAEAIPSPSPSPSTSPSASPSPTVSPSPVAVTCTKTLAAGGEVQPFVDSLTRGDTGCLRGGTYTTGINFVRPDTSTARITLRSYPGERAKIMLTSTGRIFLGKGTNYITISDLDIDGTNYTANTSLRIEGNIGFRLERNDITNHNKGTSCLFIGTPTEGEVQEATIQLNRFHECGNYAHINQDHAIYADRITNSTITDNTFWGSSAYAIQVYPNSNHNTISHNVIDGSGSYRGGVVVGGESGLVSNDNIFEYNVVAYVSNDPNSIAFEEYQSTVNNQVRYNCLHANRVDIYGSGWIRIGNVTVSTSVEPFFTNKAGHTMQLAPGVCSSSTTPYDTAQKIVAEWAKN